MICNNMCTVYNIYICLWIEWMDVLNEHWGMSLARPNGCSAVQDVLPHLNALLSDRILSQLLSIVVTTWLVAGLEPFLFFHILVIVTITDFHIFQRGWNHQPDDFYFELFFFEHMVRDSSPSFFWNCGISNNFLILLETLVPWHIAEHNLRRRC